MIEHTDHDTGDAQTDNSGDAYSPVTAQRVASASTSYSETRLSNGKLYWLERRPQQAGRTTIMCHHDGRIDEMLPDAYNCRSRAHEYGGGCYVATSEAIYFINDADQQVHAIRDGEVHCITSRYQCRFADLHPDTDNNRLFAVCEEHSGDGLPENSLVAIDILSGSVTRVTSGYDFYCSPKYQHGQLCWLCWNFPDMPWDSTYLYTAHIDTTHKLSATTLVAGGPGISVCQPQWHDEALYYVADNDNWWNVHRYHDNEHTNLYPVEAECAEPHWVFGQSSYCLVAGELIVAANRNGVHELIRIDIDRAQQHVIACDFSHFGYLTGDDQGCAMIACATTRQAEIITLNRGELNTVLNTTMDIDAEWLSIAEPLSLTARDGGQVHAFYYPPTNPLCKADSSPTMIVLGHGGPTGQSTSELDLRKQFWTSRGFAILDVNYRGSTGYGRHYRDALYDRWGELDVHDLCDAAIAVCQMGKADINKLIIKGSSAGGFTVLAALTFEDVFCAGASYYGISDLETLVSDTHKFEARYLDKLVGPYPQTRQTYIDRSPIHHVDQLACPVIFFQGEEDLVVPKQQAESMIDALLKKGIRVGYRLYPGEQHGFRQAETIIDALQTELCFYRQLFSDAPIDCDAAIVSERVQSS